VNPLAPLAGLARILGLWARGDRVGAADYAEEYDEIAPGYGMWTDRMGKWTLRILPPGASALPASKPLKIVDLCSGTGFLARELLRAAGPGWSIACVDASEAMTDSCRASIADPRCAFVAGDALGYLESLPDASVDALFCGWGLVYLDSPAVIRALARVLVPGGVAGFIMNRAGTLAGVEGAVVREMLRRPRSFLKVMDIRFAMPRSLRAFERRFLSEGLSRVDSGEGEEIASFGTEAEYRRWLLGTGALAGVFRVFAPGAERDAARDAVIARIAERSRTNGGYRMNHRFAWGIFKKEDRRCIS